MAATDKTDGSSGSVILSRLSALSGAVAAKFRESALYRGAGEGKGSGRLRRAWRESLLGGALSRAENESAYDGSAIYNAVDRAEDKIIGAAGRRYERVAADPDGSFFVRLYRKTLGRLGFFDYDFILGAFFTVMFCFPGQIWSNLYATAGVFALALLLFILTAAKKREVFRPRSMGLPFLLFNIAALCGIGTSSEKGDALRVYIFFLTAFMIAVLIAASVTDAAKLRSFLGFIFIAVFVTAVIGILQRLAGVEINESLTDVNANRGMPGRIFATFENPNNYAEFLVMFLPMCAVFALNAKTTAAKLLCAALTAVPFGALLMTYSRSSWIGIAVAAVIFVFMYNKKLFPLFIIACVVMLPLADLALGGTIFDRVMTLFTVRANNTRDSSMMYRVYIWQGAADMLGEYWHTGIGLGPAGFKSAYLFHASSAALNAVHSHMLYLEIWLEMGLLGIVSYLAYIVTLLKNTALSAVKAVDPVVRGTLIAAFSSIAGISATAAVEYVWYYPRVLFAFFTLTGVAAAAVGIARRENSE